MSPIALGVMLGCALLLGGGIGWLLCAAAGRTDREIDDLGRQRLGERTRELRAPGPPPPAIPGQERIGRPAEVERRPGGGWSGTGDVR